MALEHMLQQLQLLSQAAVSTSSEQAKKPTPPSKQPQQVYQGYETYVKDDSFNVGDMVKWKPGMKNRQRPKEGEPAIVIEFRPQDPLFTTTKKETDAGSPLYREPLTLAVGMLDNEKDLIIFYFDHHRFTAADASSFRNFDSQVSLLRDTANALLIPNPQFIPGDIVCWKPHLKNKKQPARDSFAVVQEMLSVPLYDTQKSAGTPYFHEPLDMKLGILDSDGDFMLFHYDSRRLQKRN